MSRVWIFDWDDSLLPSSWLGRLEEFYGGELKERIQPFLNNLQDCVCSWLMLVHKHYSTFLITNAESNWIEFSCAKYMPKVLDKIMELKIPIVSARERYAKSNPHIFNVNDCREWKKETFWEVLKVFKPLTTDEIKFDIEPIVSSIHDMYNYKCLSDALFELESYSGTKRRNTIELVVMGDSIHDLNAAHSLEIHDWIRLKTIKLVEFPDIQTLTQELGYLYEKLDGIPLEGSSISISQILHPPRGLLIREENDEIIKINHLPIIFIPLQLNPVITIETSSETTNLAVPNAPELTEVISS